MNASPQVTGWSISLWQVLAATALAWGFAGAGAAWCLASSRIVPSILWIMFGLAASQVILYGFIRQGRCRLRKLQRLSASLMEMLEAQSTALAEQQHQIAALQAASHHRIRQQISGLLTGQITSNLERVGEELEQAEAALPDVFPQTRQWIARTRLLTANAFAGLEGIGRMPPEAEKDDSAWQM